MSFARWRQAELGFTLSYDCSFGKDTVCFPARAPHHANVMR